jgi:GNAT superfamily N-acetyltransferase
MNPSIQLRPAHRDDCALILSLIRELADYERLLHEVEASAANLEQHLFGPTPRAEALIVETGDGVAGFALFFHNFSTFVGKPGLYLEDLYIRPAFRGLGYGRRIMQRLAQIALERDCGRFEWWVLDWNEPAIEFYRSIGARPMSEWTVQRVDGEALRALARGES